VEKNLHILDPIARGSYAEDYLRRTGADAPRVLPGDFALISAPTDFLGLNVYSGFYVRAAAGRPYEELALPASYPRADSKWLNLMPQAIYWVTRFAHECYGPKEIYITENGCGYNVEPVEHGEVIDLHRRDFLRGYLRELNRAIQDGVPVRGYFVWSFMDNFEWEDGYTRRFGIVHVDFATQQRTPKLSSRYYSEVIRANAVV
jgi:beta-glucosidase